MQLLIAHTAVIQIITHQINNANNDSSSYGSSASEEPGNSYTGSVNNAPYGSPFDNDKSDN